MHEFKHVAYVIEHIKNDENVTKGCLFTWNTVCLFEMELDKHNDTKWIRQYN